MAIKKPQEFKQLITQLQIEDTPAEFHGFLCGLIAGGIQDDSWKTLTYQFTHDGHAFSVEPLTKLTEFYQQLTESFWKPIRYLVCGYLKMKKMVCPCRWHLPMGKQLLTWLRRSSTQTPTRNR